MTNRRIVVDLDGMIDEDDEDDDATAAKDENPDVYVCDYCECMAPLLERRVCACCVDTAVHKLKFKKWCMCCLADRWRTSPCDCMSRRFERGGLLFVDREMESEYLMSTKIRPAGMSVLGTVLLCTLLLGGIALWNM